MAPFGTVSVFRQSSISVCLQESYARSSVGRPLTINVNCGILLCSDFCMYYSNGTQEFHDYAAVLFVLSVVCVCFLS